MSHFYPTGNLFLVPLNVLLVYFLVLSLEFRSVLKMCCVLPCQEVTGAVYKGKFCMCDSVMLRKWLTRLAWLRFIMSDSNHCGFRIKPQKQKWVKQKRKMCFQQSCCDVRRCLWSPFSNYGAKHIWIARHIECSSVQYKQLCRVLA